jgi:metal-responsive CopG/Arc/MetJ family transcriptional regulator
MRAQICTVIGISLPKTLFKEIDDVRGDVPRSIYIRRILEQNLKAETERKARALERQRKEPFIKKAKMGNQ